MTSLSLLERLNSGVARQLNRLPARVQVLLSGGRPITRDGLTLHPEIQLVLALRKALGAKPVHHFGPEVSRRRLRREAIAFAGTKVEVGSVRDFDLKLPERTLLARHYSPPGASKNAPLLVFFHGGGFVVGDLETHDSVCRVLCRYGGVHVLAMEYRLAPEAPFPAAVEDAYASYQWACANAQTLGADASQILVGGDSAGGNLAAVVSQLAVNDGLQRPALQLLIYPAVDRTRAYPSLDLFHEGFFLGRAEVDWYHRTYSGDHDNFDPRLGPIHARDLSGLPPAVVITAGFDPLRDEGEAYAAALQTAGTKVVLRRFDGFVHAFINMTGISRACHDGVVEIAEAMKQLLAENSQLVRDERKQVVG